MASDEQPLNTPRINEQSAGGEPAIKVSANRGVADSASSAREIIATALAPAAMGTYSQAVRAGAFVFLSGQIPLHPTTMQIVSAEPAVQIEQVFTNLAAVAAAAGCTLQDAVKLTVYLTDLSHFGLVNDAMARHFSPPYPARAALGVAALPRGALVEVDAILLS